MSTNKPILLAVYTLTLGAIVGTLIGEILGFILPEGVVKQFFLLSKSLSVGPGALNIIILQLTLGLSITLNVISLIGIAIAYYLLRWWR